VTGVHAVDLESGRKETYEAPAVVIATGGAGQLFSHTTNPEIATGDGIALAFEAGAEVADLSSTSSIRLLCGSRMRPPSSFPRQCAEGAVLRNIAARRS
jgi:L-aspartate oxidase